MARVMDADGLKGRVTGAVLDYANENCGGEDLSLTALRAWRLINDDAPRALTFWALSCRMKGVSWGDIGEALGMTRQAAYQRWSEAAQQAEWDELKGWRFWWRHDNGLCLACRRPLQNSGVANSDQAARKAQLTSGRLVDVCRGCGADPAKLEALEAAA